MKQPIPKSLTLSFFLIGIILGLLFIDLPLDQPSPPPVAAQSAPEAKPAPKPAPKPVKRPVQERMSKAIAKVLPEKPAEPVPAQVEPLRCDREAARQVRERAREIAEVIEVGGELNVRLGREWAFYREGHRAGFVQAFSEADSCLAGRPRRIRFYYQGQEVAIADPLTGVKMQ